MDIVEPVMVDIWAQADEVLPFSNVVRRLKDGGIVDVGRVCQYNSYIILSC